MAPLRYSINITLDGCVDHNAGMTDPELHQYSADIIGRADTLLFGRVVYQMMEGAWRLPPGGEPREGMEGWTVPFAKAIDAAPKYVVSSTLDSVDWNAELVRGDLGDAVRAIKEKSEKGVYTGGVTLPLALAELRLIDEYEFVVHPRIAGHGPTPFAGLSHYLDLVPVGRKEFASGAVSVRFEPKR
ncbi:Dihydrofolate reductase [Glycomyces sambucus]|uniref:Dihydrofolate reductase n=1 Tax=Glycomyces sambucus TaxID=380244 RepID=A0A1G9FG01_9ACTN|nr:dihydrofolate reductase family protein [Glycomyces sambucus]SDK87355.1 Dihydrofolate reductase [Glycomyces sambucus]